MRAMLRQVLQLVRMSVLPEAGAGRAADPAPDLASLPTQRIGISGNVVAKLDLPTDFDVGKGRVLRMREVTIAPGGFLPMHSHADRPAVAYVLQGTMTEYLAGEPEPVVLTPGQAYATHRQPHALLNRGDVPVVFLEIDLF